jgi:hypothetical protein
VFLYCSEKCCYIKIHIPVHIVTVCRNTTNNHVLVCILLAERESSST